MWEACFRQTFNLQQERALSDDRWWFELNEAKTHFESSASVTSCYVVCCTLCLFVYSHSYLNYTTICNEIHPKYLFCQNFFKKCRLCCWCRRASWGLQFQTKHEQLTDTLCSQVIGPSRGVGFRGLLYIIGNMVHRVSPPAPVCRLGAGNEWRAHMRRGMHAGLNGGIKVFVGLVH